jgi:protein subunit release factor A
MHTKLTFTPDDFEYQWFSGTGAGGQHRNKHQNCLRLTHKETGITVTSQSSKSRNQNLKDAYQNIILKLHDHYNSRVVEKDNTDVIRSYKLEDGLIVDHVTGDKISIKNLDDFDLSPILVKKGIHETI